MTWIDNFKKYVTDDVINHYLKFNDSNYRFKIVKTTKRDNQQVWVDMEMFYCGESRGVYGYTFINMARSYGGYSERDHFVNRTLNIINSFIEEMDNVIREQNINKLIDKL